MKNFKLIKEAWDRFMNEELDPSFMSIGAEIKGTIEDINQQVDELISGGAIFFDTETMGLTAVREPLKEAPRQPSPTPGPLVSYTTTNGLKGQMLTEIAAAYATKEEIEQGTFPSDISHTRISFKDENKKEIAKFSEFYKPGTFEFDPDKYFEAIRDKLKFAINRMKLYDAVKKKDPELFAGLSDEDLRKGAMDDAILSKFGITEPEEEEMRAHYEKYVLPNLATIKSPHQLLMMTAYFGSEEEVMSKINSGEISIEDIYNLNTSKAKQPEDTDITSEKEAIERFYKFAETKNGVPLIAQNAGFDEKFISQRAKIYGGPSFGDLGLTNVKDTLNLFKLFRNYLEELIVKAQEGKEQITAEITKMSGGSEPSKTLATLRTAKGSPTVSQGPMASALRVEATRWHTAIADIEMLFNIFSKVISILKKIAELDPGASTGSKASSKKVKL